MKKSVLILLSLIFINIPVYAELLYNDMYENDNVLLVRRNEERRDRKSDRHRRSRHHKRRMFFGDPLEMKEKFGLTDKQIAKISDINLKHRKLHLKIQEQEAPKRIQLKRLLLEKEIDLKKVRLILTELSKLQVESRMLRIKHRIEIEKQLTAEQRQKARDYYRNRMRGPKKRGHFNNEGRKDREFSKGCFKNDF